MTKKSKEAHFVVSLKNIAMAGDIAKFFRLTLKCK